MISINKKSVFAGFSIAVSFVTVFGGGICAYGSAAKEKETVQVKMLLSEAYAQKKDYDSAAKGYREIVAGDPWNVKAREGLADVLSYGKHYDEAIAEYEKMLSADPDNLVVMKKLAAVYSWDKQYARSIDIYKKITELDPKDAGSKALLGDVLSWAGRDEEAIGVYSGILEKDAGNMKVAAKLAAVYSHKKEYAKAVRLYEDIIKSDPNNVAAIEGLGDVLSWNEKYDEAIETYSRIVERSPDNTAVIKKMAAVCSWNKNYDKAKALFQKILVADPKDVNALIAMGEICLWSGEYSAALEYFEKARAVDDSLKVQLAIAETLSYSGRYDESEKMFRGILDKNPSDMRVKTAYADCLAYNKKYEEAERIYNEILTAGVDPEVKRKFADVLSWHKKYRESIIMYDELIKEGAGETVLLQKARVLGWAREYEKSLKAYDEAYQKTKDDKIKLEMEAKDAYWSARVKKAISKYNELIKRDFQNVEAMFDLSQVYSYQRMWGEARSEYEKILGLAPAHFRAKEGLEKTDLISKHIRLDSSYDYFESDSQSRDSDIRRHSAVEKLYVPINDKTSFEAEDWMTERMFSDFSDVFENRTKLRLNYANGPDWWIDGMYTAYTYSKGINTMHNFGGSFTFRAFDLALFRSSYERERLENSSEVIRGGYYKDTFMERVDMDLTQRLKLGGDYSFSSFHPENSRNLAGGDVLYYFSFDPLRFTAKYRYSYDEYNKKVIEYFSPKGFTTNTFSFNWRHYLNKNGMFFGANDIYYEAGYDVSVDSTYIASHRFSGGLYWDITKSFAVALNGFITNSSVDVYKERRIIASLKYYF